jgi:hypothetical protein
MPPGFYSQDNESIGTATGIPKLLIKEILPIVKRLLLF